MPRGGKAGKNSRPRRGGRRLHCLPDDVLGEVVVLSDNDIVADEDRYNEYYLGFSWGGRECYEFGPEFGNCKREIPKSKYLGYTGCYSDLGASELTNVSIGFWGFKQAIENIISGKGLQD
ncbi:hypothetical protein Tco_1252499 [Tanacetum coccineum]